MNPLEQALVAANARMDKIEARQVATDLMLFALIQTHPDVQSVCSALEQSADSPSATQTQHPEILAEAIARTRKLVALLRRDESPAAP